MAVRFRRTPLQIRFFGGPSSGRQSTAFGSYIDSLNQTLGNLQDTEAMRKLADGDPETFTAYWDQRKKYISKSNPLYTLMEDYYGKAQRRLKLNKGDASALASYVRTNNHQAYLNYLLGRLGDETDQAVISKMGTQINELRSRIYQSGSGSASLGGGVSQQSFVDARDAWNSELDKVNNILSSRPLTTEEVGELKKAKDAYSGVLRQIATAPETTITRADTMNTALRAVTGPNDAFLNNTIFKSDQKLVENFKTDDQFASQIALLDTPGARARAYADRAAQLALLISKAQSSQGLSLITKSLQDAEARSASFANQATTKSSKPTGRAEEYLDAQFATYESDITKARKKNPRVYPSGPISESEWLRQLKASPDAESFNSYTLWNVSPDLFQTLKGAINSQGPDFGPAKYDMSTGQWTGDPEAVKNAMDAVSAVQAQWDIPGNQFEMLKKVGFTDPGSILSYINGDITPSTLQNIYNRMPFGGFMSPTNQKMQSGDIPGEATTPEPTTPPAPGVPTPSVPSADQLRLPGLAQDASAPSEQAGGPKVLPAKRPEPVDSPADFEDARLAADSFLGSYNLPDLPAFTKPENQPTPDESLLFPFEGTSGGSLGGSAPSGPNLAF